MKFELEPDEIRNPQQDAFFEDQHSSVSRMSEGGLFLLIVSAILVAMLIAWFVKEAYDRWQIERALQLFNQEMQNINNQSNKAINQITLQSQALMRQSQANVQRQKEEAYQKRLALHQIELNRQAALAAEVEERNKKSIAWGNYFKPSPECINDDGQNLMKCANDHARAKKNFELSWAKNH
jgi:hypothetical protein